MKSPAISRRRGECFPPPSGVGWVLSLGLVGYATLIHHGLGAARPGLQPGGLHPSGFLRELDFLEPLSDHWLVGIFLLSALPTLGTVATWVSGRSSIATAVSASSLATVSIMAFYGLSPALRIWEFFHWRASLVFLITGIALGFTLAAPLLAERWLQLKFRWKVITYGPIFFVVTSLMRNVTGSDETLFLNLAPWPAISVLGLEIGAQTLAGLMAGVALGVIMIVSAGRQIWLRVVGFAMGAATPILILGRRLPLDFPEAALGLVAASAIVLGLVLLTRSNTPSTERIRRATNFFIAACLVGLPIIAGEALAEGDYSLTRDVRARKIINALALYYQHEETYPDELGELVEGGYLEELPSPRIGYSIYYDVGWLKDQTFDYRNLGPNYLLEFSATKWVMCSYNPPWQLDEDELEDPENSDLLVESWTCPAGSPDLW